jgi:predicted alpha/beta superfamily hydrolase
VKRFYIILACQLLFVQNLVAQFQTTRQIVYSEIVKDSFEIYFSIPQDYNPDTNYDLFVYGDANLISGKELRKQLHVPGKLSLGRPTIFLGIGYKGKDHRKRNRDFLLPKIKNGDTISTKNKGRCREFYSFIKQELVPFASSKFSLSDSRSIMGHSFGGLFVFYCLFRNEDLFRNYFALSPSLWVNRNGIYRFNKIGDSVLHKSYLYFSAGSKEDFNLILSVTKKMNRYLLQQAFPNLRFEYEVHRAKGHFSQVKYSIKKILTLL